METTGFLCDFSDVTLPCVASHTGCVSSLHSSLSFVSEETDSVSSSRCLSLILVFSRSSPAGVVTLVNPQKRQTNHQPTHCPPFSVFPPLLGEREEKPQSMAYKPLRGPVSLSSNSATCPPSLTGLFSVCSSCLPQGLCTHCFLYLLSGSLQLRKPASLLTCHPTLVLQCSLFLCTQSAASTKRSVARARAS